MRYLYIVVAAVFMLCGVTIMSETASAMCGNCGTVEKGKAGAVEKEAPLADDEEFGEDNRREMPQYENYDENTGMPNVVESDKTGELE